MSKAIDSGSKDVRVTFTTAVNQQLASELEQFLKSEERIGESIKKLGEQIEKSRQDRKAPGAGQAAA